MGAMRESIIINTIIIKAKKHFMKSRKHPKTIGAIIIMAFFMLCVFAACARKPSIILATTTSVQDSGLLDALVPVFEKESGITVKTIAVGSGKAIALGARGEADVLLVHSPKDEEAFMQKGYGIRRRALMYNTFTVVGPKEDPAHIKNSRTIIEAFRAIARHGALFISRGDNSGTHALERDIWEKSGIIPDGKKWYQESGLGMGETLSIASEKQGYTITDRATWIAVKRTLALEELFRGWGLSPNFYHIIEIHPGRFQRINTAGASTFAEFLLSKKTKDFISTFGIDRFGEPLFIPVFSDSR